MPITIKEIQILKRLSSSNLIKHTCENCGDEYYSIRKSKFCGSACKQNSYRNRLLNENTISETKQIFNQMPVDTEENPINQEIGAKKKQQTLSLSQKVLQEAQERLKQIK